VLAIRLIGPQKGNVVFSGLRDHRKPIDTIEKLNCLLFGDCSEAIDILTLAGSTHDGDCISPEDTEVNLSIVQNAAEGDSRIIESVLDHIGKLSEGKAKGKMFIETEGGKSAKREDLSACAKEVLARCIEGEGH